MTHKEYKHDLKRYLVDLKKESLERRNREIAECEVYHKGYTDALEHISKSWAMNVEVEEEFHNDNTNF